MKLSSFEAITNALHEAGVHFIVVGGLAVNAHGYLRFTNDVDLVVRLARENVIAAFRALEQIDYRPSNPITAEDFANATIREAWRREKGMRVLKLWSDRHRETPIDIFIYEPFDFETEYARAFRDEEESSTAFVSIPALIAMKREANRMQDRIDIEKLEKIVEIRRDEARP